MNGISIILGLATSDRTSVPAVFLLIQCFNEANDRNICQFAVFHVAEIIYDRQVLFISRGIKRNLSLGRHVTCDPLTNIELNGKLARLACFEMGR